MPAFRPTLHGVVLRQVTLKIVLTDTFEVSTPWLVPKPSGLAAMMQLATRVSVTSNVAVLLPFEYVAAPDMEGRTLAAIRVETRAARANCERNMKNLLMVSSMTGRTCERLR